MVLSSPDLQVVEVRGHEFIPIEALEVKFANNCLYFANHAPLQLLSGAGVPPTRLGADQAVSLRLGDPCYALKTTDTDSLQAAMIKVAAKRPDERQRQIEQQRAHVAYEANARIRSWGLEASMTMKQITGRVLPPPKVQYSQAGKVKEPSVGRGQWNCSSSCFAILRCDLADLLDFSARHQIHWPEQATRALGNSLLCRSGDWL